MNDKYHYYRSGNYAGVSITPHGAVSVHYRLWTGTPFLVVPLLKMVSIKIFRAMDSINHVVHGLYKDMR